MTLGFYTVRRGDNLTKIAKEHDTTPQAIADLNHLGNLNLIRVGQKLVLPSPIPKAESPSITSVVDEAGQVWMSFVDVVNRPIEGIKIFVEGLQKDFEGVTDSNGNIPVLPVKHGDSPITVSVEKVGGGKKEIAKFSATTARQLVTFRSPKMKVQSILRPHQDDVAKEVGPAAHPTGTVIDTRSTEGHPLKQVALECPNKDNLRLGDNSKYRNILLAASARSGFTPQAIAALLDAEAALVVQKVAKKVRDKSGNPVIDSKTGRPKMRLITRTTGEWNARSQNKASSARGVSQVLDGTWIEMAVCRGTFLNERARKEGWIVTTKTEKKVGNKIKRIEIQAFKLSDGTLVTKVPLYRVLSRRPYLSGRASASDRNLQDLLNLRFDVECAIHTAVDYGKRNMKDLYSRGLHLDNLSDGEKAKIMYLCHHLGSKDARDFIEDVMPYERARYLLKTQFGDSKTAELKAARFNGDFVKAHRDWLTKFIDNRIKISNHFCKCGQDCEVRSLISITESIRRR